MWKRKDSLLVKVKSGIQACIQMDIIKDMPEFLIPSIENSIYTYTSEGVTFLEDRFVNVVHFEQKKGISEPLFCGELFLDSETSTLLQARLEVHPVYVKNAAGMFVERRARNVRMIPQKWYIPFLINRGKELITYIISGAIFISK